MTHFLTVKGTAGMYNTEESPPPRCSASTAWTTSQCPRKRSKPCENANQICHNDKRTINLISRFNLGNRYHTPVQPQMRVCLLVELLRPCDEATGEGGTSDVKLPVVNSQTAVGPRFWAEEGAKQDISRCEGEHGEKTKSASAGTGGHQRGQPLPTT